MRYVAGGNMEVENPDQEASMPCGEHMVRCPGTEWGSSAFFRERVQKGMCLKESI